MDNATRDKLAEIGVVFAVLYGSQAKEEAAKGSDVDVAVLLDRKPVKEDFGRLFALLSESFPGKEVDVRFLNRADVLFAFQVVKHGELIYGDEKTYGEYKLYIHRRYIDDGRKYFPYKELLLKKNQEELERRIK